MRYGLSMSHKLLAFLYFPLQTLSFHLLILPQDLLCWVCDCVMSNLSCFLPYRAAVIFLVDR